MTISHISHFREIVDGKAPIPINHLAYFRERQRNRLYDLITGKFLEKEKKGELSRAELARRIDKDPAQITKWLSSPGNWTLDTISDLTLAICAGELEYAVAKLIDAKPRNSSQMSVLGSATFSERRTTTNQPTYQTSVQLYK